MKLTTARKESDKGWYRDWDHVTAYCPAGDILLATLFTDVDK